MKPRPIISSHIARMFDTPGIARQYQSITSSEQEKGREKPWKGKIDTGIHGTERMYGSEMIVFASQKCPAKCVACIRKNYNPDDVLRETDLGRLRDYVNKEDIKEVLITGGDPLTNPDYTLKIIAALSTTNVRHVRIGTSMFRADPERISDDFIHALSRENELGCALRKQGGFLEVSPHFDHPAEFTNKTIQKIDKFNKAGIRLYVQTILLKGVNGNPKTFRELSERIRDNGMEWYYFYHCVPIMGNSHLRTSIQNGFQLMDSLENHEEVTGRHPPKRYAIPLPIGKVTLDPSRLIEREGDFVWIETRYTSNALRRERMPSFCRIGKRGFLEVKYLDGKD